ncbi:hypothetical protein AHAS_Ahas04G0094300 [Arachis hypogaea]
MTTRIEILDDISEVLPLLILWSSPYFQKRSRVLENQGCYIVVPVFGYQSEETNSFDREVIIDLMQMIYEHNVIAQSFRRAREFYEQDSSQVICLRLFSERAYDQRIYGYPSCDEVATLIVGDFDSSDCGCDIIV